MKGKGQTMDTHANIYNFININYKQWASRNYRHLPILTIFIYNWIYYIDSNRSPTLYIIMLGKSEMPSVTSNLELTRSHTAYVDVGLDISQEKVDWDKLSLFLSVIVENEQPRRACFCCLGNTPRSTKEGLVGWRMKRLLLYSQFPYNTIE